MKKNRFLTFLFSIIPGCGLMYVGYLKKGLQFMLTFVLVCIFFNIFTIFSRSFFLLLPCVWFYQMFDTMHTVVRMKKQGIELPEDDGFYLPDVFISLSSAQRMRATKMTAVILALAGSFNLVSVVLNALRRCSWIDQGILYTIDYVVLKNLFPATISIILIIIGIKLFRGNKVKKTNAKDVFIDKDGTVTWK